jgi:hypothetical protein
MHGILDVVLHAGAGLILIKFPATRASAVLSIYRDSLVTKYLLYNIEKYLL